MITKDVIILHQSVYINDTINKIALNYKGRYNKEKKEWMFSMKNYRELANELIHFCKGKPNL